MSEANEVAVVDRKAITVTVAERYGMEADTFELALRNTVFLEGSKAEYAAFLVVCNEYKLNPLTKEIYAFKNKSGKIVPVVSIDGWVSLCNTHPAFDGMTFEDLHAKQAKLYAITCTIYRKDRSHPTVVTEYLSECIRSTEPWKMQHRMLRHKTLIQCARYAFGFSGIYDQDEADHLEATLLPEGDAVSLAAPGFKEAVKTRRKPAAAEPVVEPEDQVRAAQADEGDEPVVDAEFEDAASEGPTPPTASAKPADAGLDTSASASEASQAQTGSGQPLRNEPSRDGSQAPPNTLYIINGETPDAEDDRVLTYKNGRQFGRAKLGSKVCPPAFDHHAPAKEAPGENSPPTSAASPVEEAETQEEAGEFEDDDSGDPVADGVRKMLAAGDYGTIDALRKEIYTDADGDQKAGIRIAIWKRYAELRDDGVAVPRPYEDFWLMRSFMEFGATTAVELDVEWKQFERHQAFTSKLPVDQGAMSKLWLQRQAILKDGGRG